MYRGTNSAPSSVGHRRNVNRVLVKFQVTWRRSELSRNWIQVASAISAVVLSGCASSVTGRLQFVPVNVATGNSQAQDEAQCRKEFHEYRTGINSNWFSNRVYVDCMIAKGYEEAE